MPVFSTLLTITSANYGETADSFGANIAVKDATDGKTLAEEPLFGTRVTVVNTDSLDNPDWRKETKVVTDGEGVATVTDPEAVHGPAAEEGAEPKSKFTKLVIELP